MMKKFVLPIMLLAACGGSNASTPPSVVPSANAPVADDNAAAAAAATDNDEGGAAALDAWYRVQTTTGHGLSVGSGVRFRAGGFDVASGRLAQTMAGSCTPVEAGIDCDGAAGPLEARVAPDGGLVARQGPNELGLVRAAAEESDAFSAALAAHDEQRTACMAAGNCCMEAENELGIACDLNARLGDRSAASCRAALATMQTEFAPRASAMPASCR